MVIRVAINGFGRTGRLAMRSAFERGLDIEFVAVNRGEPEKLGHLLKYDSVHGRFPFEVEIRKKKLEKIKANIKQNDELLSKSEYWVPNQKHGFFKDSNGDYYATLKSAPHAYKIGNHYYCFEETSIGVKIPVNGDQIGEIKISESRPKFLDKSYIHLSKSWDESDHYLCFAHDKTEGDVLKSMEGIVKRAMEKGINDPLKHKALKIRYLLKDVAENCMMEGYDPKNVAAFRQFDQNDAKLKQLRKNEQGHNSWVQNLRQTRDDINLKII